MLELNENEKKYLETFIESFNIRSTSSVLEFASIVEDRINSVNEIITKNSRNKDNSEIELLVSNIIEEINKINTTPKKSSWFKRLFGSVEEEIKPNYDLMLSCIDKLSIELKKHIITLQKDSQLISLLGDNNKEYIHELDMYLLAGSLIIEKYKKEAEKFKNDNNEFEYNDCINAINNLEKRLNDLKLTRMVCIQNGPQINLILNINYLLIDKINFLINTTIPLWKSEILMLINNEKGKIFANKNKEIQELMNKILLDNSNSLIEMSNDVKKELKEGEISHKGLLETTKLVTKSLEEINNLNRSDNKEEEAKLVLK